MAEIKLSIEDISEITKNNKDDIKAFIKQQKQNNKTDNKEGDEQNYTFEEDLQEIKVLIGDVIVHINKLQQTNEEIKDRAKNLGGTGG